MRLRMLKEVRENWASYLVSEMGHTYTPHYKRQNFELLSGKSLNLE